MSRFHFKKFTIHQSRSALKVGTDAMILGATIKTDLPKYGLDVGAGTGVLSLMVAQNHPSISINAIEIDDSSFKDLNQNISESEFKNQISVLNTDFFLFQSSKKYDLIFSNPPFYDDGLKFSLETNYHSKHSLNFSKSLFFSKIVEILSDYGHIWIIIPFDKSQLWINSALDKGLFLYKRIDIKGKPMMKIRSILVFTFNNNDKIEHSNILIRDSDGFYTKDYLKLTEDFHNKRPLK